MARALMVCTGNICRSPMAEVVVSAFAADAGLEGLVRIGSRGVSDEEHGNPIDPRAAGVLRAAGYQLPRHRAAQVTAGELAEQDLVLAMTYSHLRWLQRMTPGAANLRMYREFDPALAGTEPSSALDIDDPWYGGRADFEHVLEQIEAGAPAIVGYLKELA